MPNEAWHREYDYYTRETNIIALYIDGGYTYIYLGVFKSRGGAIGKCISGQLAQRPGLEEAYI